MNNYTGKLLFLLTPFFFHQAAAQVVLTESIITDRFGITESVTVFDTEETTGLQAIVDASGENQTWDFSTIQFTDTLRAVQSFVALPADLPGNDLPEFADATFVEYTMSVEAGDTLKTLLYQSLTSGALHSHGIIFIGPVDGMQDTVVTLASPPALEGVLPFAFESSYSDSTTFIIDGVPDETYELIEVVADGWGTLVTATQTAPALRIFNREMTFLKATGALLSTYYSIDFISAEGLTAEIELDDAMQPVAASYATFSEGMHLSNELAEDELPGAFRLDQNYPNPFNPSTNISFEVYQAAQITLKVYTLNGQRIETLLDGFLPAGRYNVSFQAPHLASGRYIYRMASGAGVETRVLSLIK